MKSYLVSKLVNFILTVAIIAVGLYCGFATIEMFDVSKSQELGNPPVTATSKEDLTEVAKYDISYIDFEKTETGYSATYTFDAIKFDGTTNEYSLFFNGIKLESEQTAGTLTSVLDKNFYNTTNELSASVSIEITLTFTAQKTTLNFTSENTGDELSYFATYMNIYGVIITVGGSTNG